MSVVRILLHSFVLNGINYAAVLAGAWARYWAHNNYAMAAVVAVPMTVLAFPAWMLAVKKLRLRPMLLRNAREGVRTYVLSLLWGPVVFVPLHYATQGYLTSVGNIVAIASFQLPVNAMATLWATHAALGRRIEPDETGSESDRCL
jgi:hypothetical protein